MGANEIFSKNLKFYIIRSGRTQTQIALDLGVSKGTLSDWCSGRSHPRMSRVQEIAEYFGINKSDLLENGKRGLEEDTAVIIRELNNKPKLKTLFSTAIKLDEKDIGLTILFIERLSDKK